MFNRRKKRSFNYWEGAFHSPTRGRKEEMGDGVGKWAALGVTFSLDTSEALSLPSRPDRQTYEIPLLLGREFS